MQLCLLYSCSVINILIHYQRSRQRQSLTEDSRVMFAFRHKQTMTYLIHIYHVILSCVRTRNLGSGLEIGYAVGFTRSTKQNVRRLRGQPLIGRTEIKH